MPEQGSKLKRYLVENFGGGIKSDVAGIYINDNFVPDALNVDFSLIKGAVRKRMGYVRVNGGAGLDGAVTGGYQDYVQGGWRNILCAGTKIYDWDQVDDSAAVIETGMTDGKNYFYDFCTSRTSADGPVIIMTNGVDEIRKYDGTTCTELALTEGYNYFKARYCAMFNNHCFFANTKEGANLANDWTNTAGTIYSYNNNDKHFQPEIEVAEVWNDTTQLTEETTSPTTPANGEYGISAGVLYVNIGGAPGTNIHITYKNVERVRWMDLGNAQGYTADQFIDVVTSPGMEIRRIVPLRDLLIVYKEDSIWAIYYTGDSTAPFGLYCIDHNTKCIAGFSVSDVKGEHYFLSEEGIMKTNGAKVDPVLVSKNVPEWFSYVSTADWKYAYAETSEYKKQYRLLVPYLGGDDVTDKDRVVVFDYEDNTWAVHKYAGNANVIFTMTLEQAGTWDSISRYWDEIDVSWEHPSLWSRHTRFFTGDYSGYVRLHDTVERDDEGTDQAIESYVITKPINLSQSGEEIGLNKRLHRMRARLKSFDSSTLSFYRKLDGESEFSSIGSIDLGRTPETFADKLDLSGTCREIEYKIGNNASLQPWALYWLETQYLLRSEQ